MTAAYEQIKYAVENGIATITLNRPEKLNAFTGQMMSELIDAFARVNTDDAVRCVIVTGAGRAFAQAPISRQARKPSTMTRARTVPRSRAADAARASTGRTLRCATAAAA